MQDPQENIKVISNKTLPNFMILINWNIMKKISFMIYLFHKIKNKSLSKNLI